MEKLKTDSPIARRIARSFLQFLDSVEPAAGVDLEGLEVARDCITDTFQLGSQFDDNFPKVDSLVSIFRSLDSQKKSYLTNKEALVDATASSSAHSRSIHTSNASETSKSPEDPKMESGCTGDELFAKFIAALDKIHFIKALPDGREDPVQLSRAVGSFNSARDDMEKSGCQTYNVKTLAETFKTKGNTVMQGKMYADAIELYSFAIALCEDNAIYYCNRAAAYTQIQKYAEAIRDCLKSIEINPNYSKAYSRLGFAYYAQGNYTDAIEKGFKKALQLDPNNESVKENIQAARMKLQQQQWSGSETFMVSTGYDVLSTGVDGGVELRERPGRSSSHVNTTGGASSHGPVPSPFTSGVPADFTNMFMNMAGNGNQGNANGSVNTTGGASSHGPIPSPFTSGVPAEFTNMFMNMAGNGNQGNANGSVNTTGDASSHGSIPSPFTSGVPVDLTNMFMYMAGNGNQGNANGGVNTTGGASSHGSIPSPFTSGVPVDLTNMFMNMAENGNHGNANGGVNTTGGASSHGSIPSPFTSGVPADLTNMFMNMAGNGNQSNANGNDEAQVRATGNINLNLGEQMPEELSGVLRSVMGMFSGASPQQDSQDTAHGRSAQN